MKNSSNFVDRLAQSIQIKFDRKLSADNNAVDCAKRAQDTEAKIKDTFPKV